MTDLRSGFPPLPERMKKLAVDERGYPVPFFVAWFEGKPDFRVVSPVAVERCIREYLCWICGQRLGTFKVFVGGPRMVAHQLSAEPPSHRACAEFAVAVCPFLAHPQVQHRSVDNLPQVKLLTTVAGHNPGVSALVTTKAYGVHVIQDQLLFRFAAEQLEWYLEGRRAGPGETAEAERIVKAIENGDTDPYGKEAGR